MRQGFIDPDCSYIFCAIFDNGKLTETRVRPVEQLDGSMFADCDTLTIEKIDGRMSLDAATLSRMTRMAGVIDKIKQYYRGRIEYIFASDYKGSVNKRIFVGRVKTFITDVDEKRVIDNIPNTHYFDLMDCVGMGCFKNNRIKKGGVPNV